VSRWIENPSGQQEYNKQRTNRYKSLKTLMNYIICYKGDHVIDHLKSLKIMMNYNEAARVITKHKSLLLYTIVNNHKLLLYTGIHLKSFESL